MHADFMIFYEFIQSVPNDAKNFALSIPNNGE